MDCFLLFRRGVEATHQGPLYALACCSLFLLTRALRMTSSHSKASGPT